MIRNQASTTMKPRTLALIILAMLAFHAAFALVCSSIKIGP